VNLYSLLVYIEHNGDESLKDYMDGDLAHFKDAAIQNTLTHRHAAIKTQTP